MLKALHTTIQNLRPDTDRPKSRSRKWTYLSLGVALLISIPILTVVLSVFTSAGEVWSHLASTVLDDYIRNSLLLIVGVSTGVILIGVSTAWLITMTEFPGRGSLNGLQYFPLPSPLTYSLISTLISWILPVRFKT